MNKPPPEANWRVIFHGNQNLTPRIVASYRRRSQAVGHADLLNRDTNGRAAVIWSRSEDLKLLSVTQ